MAKWSPAASDYVIMPGLRTVGSEGLTSRGSRVSGCGSVGGGKWGSDKVRS